jgi:prepilin-type N-terminal cleavage/methylation domain-containing protein
VRNSLTITTPKKVMQSGFTLVELLIVIVIIGILAGVVIGVLNPVQQQNRARDASIRAQIDKMALSGKSLYVSSPRNTNRAPTGGEFINGIGNGADTAGCLAQNDATATTTCTFDLTGLTLAATCAAHPADYSGTGAAATNQCQFGYYRTPVIFRVIAKGQALPARTFVYSYEENAATGNITEGFYSCNEDFTLATDPSVTATCNRIN